MNDSTILETLVSAASILTFVVALYLAVPIMDRKIRGYER